MKLLFVNQYYWPDSAATAQMLSDLCEHLAARGHEVHVIASRGKYDEGSHAGERQPRREERAGVHVRRIRATGFGKKSVLTQAIDFASFHLLVGAWTLMTGRRYDTIVTLTTPPLIGIYATPVKLLSRGRRRHVVWVMDLHPDVEFALGMLRTPPRRLMGRVLDWINTFHLKHASACVSLGRCMTEVLVRKGVGAARVRTIPLWGHEEQESVIAPAQNPRRRELGLEGRFVVGYSGNAGLIHTFDEICAAALALRDDERFVFLFTGGGRRLAEVRDFADKHALGNIRTGGYVPREKLHEALAVPDVHLITMRPGLEGVSVPSKLYGIMAAGRPAVFVGPAASETARIIHETGCGRAITNGDTTGLVTALQELAGDAALRQQLGAAARAAFEARYNPAAGCEQWRELLESL